MIDTTTFRRVAATLTIGSFSVAALMGIAALLGAGDFGETQGRILLTTLIIGCASICMLCTLATSGTRWAAVGAAGAVAAAAPTLTALHLVWQDWNHVPDGELKVFGVGVVVAVTLAQVCLLLALAGTRESLRLVLWGTIALTGVVAVIVSGMILGSFDADEVWRVLGVAAILDVLGTLVTIALAKFGQGDDDVAAKEGPRVTVRADQAPQLQALARRAGGSVDDLVAQAVGEYLDRVQTATGAGAE